MATFTEAQTTDLAEILGTNSDLLDAHLDFYAAVITDSDKTKILAQVTRYQDGTVNGRVWFDSTESNEGFNMGAVNVASNRDPKTIIAELIQWPYAASSQASLVRG